MTRIIAGLAGGLRLAVPSGQTRPTSERVREAIFSRVEHLVDLRGLAVLDLFAGSGALGLEALSRGAASGVLVDSSAAAVSCARANAQRTGLPGKVVRSDVARYLDGPPTTRFDLVLLDPPYAVAPGEVAKILALLSAHVSDGALVVVEGPAKAEAPPWPHGWHDIGTKRYGDTVVRYAWARAPRPGDGEDEQ